MGGPWWIRRHHEYLIYYYGGIIAHCLLDAQTKCFGISQNDLQKHHGTALISVFQVQENRRGLGANTMFGLVVVVVVV